MSEEIIDRPIIEEIPRVTAPNPNETVTVSLKKEDLTSLPEHPLTTVYTDGIQHGIDNDPEDDAAKGGIIGATGGAIVGAVAGSLLGPVGAVVGGITGAAIAGSASVLAVMGVDEVDNDNNITGIGKSNPVDADELKKKE